MKNKLQTIFFCAIFFSLHFSSSLSSDLKTAYAPGETVIGELNGNIIEPIATTDFKIKNINVEIPVEYDLKKIKDKYFFWFIAPRVEGNYTMIIGNIATTALGVTERTTFMQNFSVIGNFTDYAIKPGLIISAGDFSIDAILYEDLDKNINVNFPNEREITLKPGDNKISFSIAGQINGSIDKIQVGKYRVPIYLPTRENYGRNVSGAGFDFYPEIIEGKFINAEESKTYEMTINNLENRTIEGIYFDYDKTKFTINLNDNLTLSPNQKIYFNLTVKNISERESYDTVYGHAKGVSALFVVKTMVEESTSPNITAVENGSSNKKYKCSEIENGRFCSSGENCSGQNIAAQDGNCCVGTCLKVDAGGQGTSSWIGYLLIAILVLVIIYVYFNYKKIRSDKNPLKKKVEEAEKKMP